MIFSNKTYSELESELTYIFAQIKQAFSKSLCTRDPVSGEKNYFTIDQIFANYGQRILKQFNNFAFY